jgi:hypothetical protein
MSFPGGVNTITVTGSYVDAAGNSQSGVVLWTPSWAVTDATGKIMVAQVAVPAPLVSGAFSVELACTDNTGFLPAGWAYVVTVAVPGASQVFNTYLPHTLGSTVDISDLAPYIFSPAPPTPETGVIQPGSAAGGSLSGTYPNPGVIAINGVFVSGTPTAGQVLTATSATTADWAAP